MNKKFWLALAERAIRSFAQGVLTVFTAGAMLNIATIQNALIIGASYAVYSALTSIALGLPEAPTDTNE